jgi:hypothetical protein
MTVGRVIITPPSGARCEVSGVPSPSLWQMYETDVRPFYRDDWTVFKIDRKTVSRDQFIEACASGKDYEALY